MKHFSLENMKHASLAALLMASALFTACSGSDDDLISNQSATQTESPVYTMTIQATKAMADDALTRGLFFNGKALSTKWNEGEEVYVVQSQEGVFVTLGKLTAAASDNGSTTLTGKLDKVPTYESDLLFYLHGVVMDYTGQTGVLLSDDNSIEKKYDYAYAYADAEWNASKDFFVDEVNKTVAVYKDLSFESQQAIVKFTFKTAGHALDIKSLTINGIRHPGTVDVDNICLTVDLGYNTTTGPLTITPASATSELYVALKKEYFAFTKFNLEATGTDDQVYTYEKTDVDFETGKYYEVTVNMKRGNDSEVQSSKIVDYSTDYKERIWD